MELELGLQLLMQGLPVLAQIFSALQEEKLTILKHEHTKELHQLNVDLESPTPKPELVANSNSSELSTISKPSEINEIIQKWPLILLPSQVITDPSLPHLIPLRIFLLPLKIHGNGFPQLQEHQVNIELNLAQGLRNFFHQYYPVESQQHPLEFIAGAWKQEPFHQEATIKSIFQVLKSEPTLILETEIIGHELNFRIAYWGMGQDYYSYKTLLSQVNCLEILKNSAKQRALNWKSTAQQLLELGEDIELIRQIGGDNVTNLELLEKEQRWQHCGIDIQNLDLPYQIQTKDFNAFSEFLATYHCIISSCIADAYHLIRQGSQPILPEILINLTPNLSEEQHEQLISFLEHYYHSFIQRLEQSNPLKSAELSLKLAKSLTILPDKSWAKRQVEYALNLWLTQRPFLQSKTGESIDYSSALMTQQDQEFLNLLKSCLMTLGDEVYLKSLSHLLNSPQPCQSLTEKKINSYSPSLTKNVVKVDSNLGVLVNFEQPHQLNQVSMLRTLPGHSGKASSIVLSPDGTTLASGSDDHTIKLWNLETGGLIQTLKGNFGRVLAISLSPDGQTLASSHRTTDRSCIKIWQPQTGELIHTLTGHHKWIYALVMSPDSEMLISGGNKIKIWNLKTGEPLQTLAGHKKWVYSLAMSPQGEILASSGGDKTIKIWNLYTGELLKTLEGHTDWIRSVVISPNGEWLASGSDDNTIRIWDIKTGKLVRILSGHSDWVLTLVFSPNSQVLMSGSKDNTIKMWQVETGQLLGTLTGHKKWVYSLAMSPDGETFASGSEDKTIKIWRTA